jgi:AcrR family transcriptional regulator
VTADQDTRRTQAARAARTRDKLFRATLDVIADRGLAALTTRGVARAAGVTVGAIYAHFESRDELVACAMEWYYAHVPDLYVPEARSLAELLCGRMQELLSSWLGDDHALAAIYAMQRELLASSDPTVRSVVENWQQARKEAFAARIEEVAAESGERLVVDAAVLAEQAIYLGVAFQELPQGLVPRYVAMAAVEELARRAVAPG